MLSEVSVPLPNYSYTRCIFTSLLVYCLVSTIYLLNIITTVVAQY